MTHTTASLTEVGLTSTAALFLTVVAAVILTVAAGVIVHALTDRRAGLAVAMAGELLLLLGVVISGFSIGLFLVPTAALAAAAILVGWLRPPLTGSAGSEG